MNKLFFAGLLLFSSLAFAETTTFEIQGMHCNGCVKTIKNMVCGTMKELKSCEVSLTDAKKEMGKLVVTGDKIDAASVSKIVDEAGYKIINTQTK